MREEYKSRSKITVAMGAWLILVAAAFAMMGTDCPVEAGEAYAYRASDKELPLKLLADIGCFLMLTVINGRLRLALATVILAYRGASLGSAASFCAVNLVPAASVAMIVSHIMISVLILIYTLLLCRGQRSYKSMAAAYFILTGGAALLRAMPFLLIKG